MFTWVFVSSTTSEHDRNEIRVPPFSAADLGYLDGEGYFAAGRKTHTFGLRVAMTDECVIDWLHEHFGGCVSRAGLTTTGNRVYTWILQRQADLLYLLPQLAPLLVAKRAQAEAMIRLIEHLRARPRYDVPSSRLSPQQRLREGRRERHRQWTARGFELRQAIVDARKVVGKR